MKIIKKSKKLKLFQEVVKLFQEDKSHMLDAVIPGAYVKSYIDPIPTDDDLVCIGITAGARFYVPKKYRQVVTIRDYGHWDYKLTCPITGESVIVSQYLGESHEVRMYLGV
ncbi:MAG: hypothetical protein J6C96_12630 [Oscillospiraceae bacterium]|nr:hypothetical protein [Oscillospiraceae bacterium]